jgi:hypothetical protein
MRCQACNVMLTTSESVRRFRHSKTFVDLCTKCLNTIDENIPTTEGIASTEEENYDE